MELAGRVVALTGGRRVGRMLAADFAAAGADIAILFNRSGDEAEAARDAAAAAGRRAVLIEADLSVPEQCRRAVDDVVAAMGRLDVLVNLTGARVRVPFDALTVETWRRTLAVNLHSAYLCALAAVPHMRRVGGGRIINCTDWTAVCGRPHAPDYLPYYVAMRGVLALTEALALELAGDGILVNAFAPSLPVTSAGGSEGKRPFVPTPSAADSTSSDAEVVRVVRSLIESEFITGEVVRLDGGRHLS